MAPMKIVRREDGFWITRVPDSVAECGPYETRSEAVEDRDGMKAFFENLEKKEKRQRKRGGAAAAR